MLIQTYIPKSNKNFIECTCLLSILTYATDIYKNAKHFYIVNCFPQSNSKKILKSISKHKHQES